MALDVQCASCFATYRVKTERAGTMLRCKECGNSIVVEDAGAPGEESAHRASPSQKPRRPPKRKKRQSAMSTQQPSLPNVDPRLLAALGLTSVAIATAIVFYFGIGGAPVLSIGIGIAIAGNVLFGLAKVQFLPNKWRTEGFMFGFGIAGCGILVVLLGVFGLGEQEHLDSLKANQDRAIATKALGTDMSGGGTEDRTSSTSTDESSTKRQARIASQAAVASKASWSFGADPIPPGERFTLTEDISITFGRGTYTKSLVALYSNNNCPFVALGNLRSKSQDVELWNFVTQTRHGGISGELQVKRPLISFDGKYLAGIVGPGHLGDAAGVWSFETGLSVREIKPKVKPHFIDFAASNQIVTFGKFERGAGGSKHWNTVIETWSILTGELVRTIQFPMLCQNYAFSPGRRYLAVQHQEGIHVYEFTTGQLVGKADFGRDAHGRTISFSPDGKELLFLFSEFGTEKIVCWDTASGAITRSKEIGIFTNAGNNVGHGEQPVQWLDNGTGWLLAGRALVDSNSGKEIWAVPKSRWPNPVKLVGDRLLIISGGEDYVELTSRKIPFDSDKHQRQ